MRRFPHVAKYRFHHPEVPARTRCHDVAWSNHRQPRYLRQRGDGAVYGLVRDSRRHYGILRPRYELDAALASSELHPPCAASGDVAGGDVESQPVGATRSGVDDAHRRTS